MRVLYRSVKTGKAFFLKEILAELQRVRRFSRLNFNGFKMRELCRKIIESKVKSGQLKEQFVTDNGYIFNRRARAFFYELYVGINDAMEPLGKRDPEVGMGRKTQRHDSCTVCKVKENVFKILEKNCSGSKLFSRGIINRDVLEIFLKKRATARLAKDLLRILSIDKDGVEYATPEHAKHLRATMTEHNVKFFASLGIDVSKISGVHQAPKTSPIIPRMLNRSALSVGMGN